MSSRDSILQRIRTAVAGDQPLPPPPVPEVWPRQNPTHETMADRFQDELALVSGEVLRAATMADAQAQLANLLGTQKWDRIATFDRPLCRELTSKLPTGQVAFPEPDWTPTTMEPIPAAVVEADHLLADTGSSMVVCNLPQERLLCYLPPVCVVAATVDRLREHMPAAWGEIGPRAAEKDRRGEFVFITGPSRTADIEKILILGVHGPKRLIVLLIGAR